MAHGAGPEGVTAEPHSRSRHYWMNPVVAQGPGALFPRDPDYQETIMQVLNVASDALTPLSRLNIALFIVLGSVPYALSAQELPSTSMDAAEPQGVTQVDFNDDFLADVGPKADLSRYARGNPLLPGEFRVDLMLNGTLLGRTEIVIKAKPGEKEGQVCITRELLQRATVDFSKLKPGAAALLAAEGACVALEEVLDNASVRMDTGALALDFIVPQASLLRTARGYVDPELWDQGITAGTIGYNFNSYRNTSMGQTTTSSYLGLNLGFNAGGWNFRHNGSMTWLSNEGSRYQTQNTFVQRDLTRLKSRLTLGEANTSGEVYDTLPFTGVQAASDDRMLPDSQRGYAPVVRGVADTNARVTIRQNGVLLYDTPVSPGPFVIDDLYPTGFGGNLDVTVTELDGRVRTFSVPFASVPQLLRPGSTRYSATVGKLRAPLSVYNPYFAQGTMQRGLTNSLTLYGGTQLSENYQSAVAGAAFGTSLGAFSAEITAASSDLGPVTTSGTSYRIGYSKFFTETGSNVAVAAYRFSTDGFLDFSSAAATRGLYLQGGDVNEISRTRNRLSLTFSQNLGDRGGALFLNAFAQNYWNTDEHDRQFQVGYGNQWRSLSYSLGVNRVRNSFDKYENEFNATLSIPLGNDRHSPTASFNATHAPNTGTTYQGSLSGSAGEEDQYTYGVSVANSRSGGTDGSVNGQYRSPYTTAQASYGQGSNFSGSSIGLSGTAIVHRGGVTLSPYTGDTMGLIEAPAAAGAKVEGYSGVKLDGRGYAVMPYLTPYRLNEVAIDPKGVSTDVEFENTTQQVAPRAGAVVRLQYKTDSGRAVFINSLLPHGEPLPFGAEVTDGRGANMGVVGQGSRIFARLKDDTRELDVQWKGDDGLDESCRIDLSSLAARDQAGSSIESFDKECHLTTATPLVKE